MGVRTESWTVKRSGLEVRMYSREKVELFLLATEDGMGPTAAAKFAGVSVGAAKKWATGHLPHSYTGARCVFRQVKIDKYVCRISTPSC